MRGTRKGRPGTRLRLRAAMVRLRSRDCAAVERLSTQIVRSTGERTHRRRPRTLCENIVNACQEYEELGSLATAKLKRKEEVLELAHPPASETCPNLLAIHAVWFVEIACITAGKSVQMQREWCDHQRAPRRLCRRRVSLTREADLDGASQCLAR